MTTQLAPSINLEPTWGSALEQPATFDRGPSIRPENSAAVPSRHPVLGNVSTMSASAENHPRLIALIAIVLGTCFLLTEHNPSVSLHNDFALSAEEMQAEAGGGNLIRRVSFITVALCGLLTGTIPRTPGRQRPVLTCLLMATIGWAALSLLWSHDPGFTLRRLIVLGCCFVGGWGLSRRLTPREYCRIAIAICGISLCLGILIELAQGTFRPWQGGYRFAGTLHPNTQGLYLTMLCLCSYALLRTGTRRPILLTGLLVVGFVFLVLTKSRTSTAGAVLALSMLTACRARLTPGPFLIGLAAIWFGSGLALVSDLWQIDLISEFKQILLMGRQEQAESLTGRLPIWTELARFVQARFWCGWGYESFWTPDHIDTVSTAVEWGVREAHSAYLETILGVGIAGLLLLVALAIAGVLRGGWEFRRFGNPLAGVVCGLMTYGLLNSFTESGMTMPLFPTFWLGVGVWSLTRVTGTDFKTLSRTNPQLSSTGRFQAGNQILNGDLLSSLH